MIFQVFGLAQDMIIFSFLRKEFAMNQRAVNDQGLIPFHLRAACQVSPLSSQLLPKLISPRPALQDLMHCWVNGCVSGSVTSSEQGRARTTVFLPVRDAGLVHSIPCIWLAHPLQCGTLATTSDNCQRNSVTFSRRCLLFSSSQLQKHVPGGGKGPTCGSPQPQVLSPVTSRPCSGRGFRWSWAYRALRCLSCRRERGHKVWQQHSEGSALEQELQHEDHIHSWWTPLQRGSKNTAMVTWKLVTAQFSLLHYQIFIATKWKQAKLLALTSCRWWTHGLSKQSLLALGFPAAWRGGIWRTCDFEKEKVLFLYYSLGDLC